MYLWIVLATFLAALAAYVLPLRSDMVGVVDTPVAQSMMIQMVVKHKAGLEYMKQHGWPFACPDGHPYSEADKTCETKNMVAYPTGDADEASADYITFGFINNPSYHNQIACLCNNGTQANPNYVNADCNGSCQQNGEETQVLRGLFTYGPIPQHWMTFDREGKAIPSGDLTTAMRKHFGSSQMAGYIVKTGSNYYIRNYEGRDFLIPSQFSGRTCINSNDACFAYLSWR